MISSVLYCLIGDTAYYLALDGNNRLTVTADKAKAAQWNITSGGLATAVTKKQGKENKTTMYYLTLSGSAASLSTAKVPIDLYEQITDETEKTYELKKVSGMRSDKPVLIMVDSLALQNNLSPVSVEMYQSGDVFITGTEISNTLLWYFEDGKLYTLTDAGDTYLTIDRNNTLTVTHTKADAVSWTIKDGRICTDVIKRVGKKDRATTYCLSWSGSAFTVNTSGSRIAFYEP